MTGIRAALFATHVLIVMAVPAIAAAGAPAMALQSLSRDDWRSVGVGGTGCWWRPDVDRGWRLAMSGRVSVVRIADRNVALAPALGARALFPFTFDRWRGGGVSVRVVSMRPGRRSGPEVLEVPASVILTVGADRSVLRGVMACGS